MTLRGCMSIRLSIYSSFNIQNSVDNEIFLGCDFAYFAGIVKIYTFVIMLHNFWLNVN